MPGTNSTESHDCLKQTSLLSSSSKHFPAIAWQLYQDSAVEKNNPTRWSLPSPYDFPPLVTIHDLAFNMLSEQNVKTLLRINHNS